MDQAAKAGAGGASCDTVQMGKGTDTAGEQENQWLWEATSVKAFFI